MGKPFPNARDGQHLNDLENAWRHAASLILKPNTFPKEPKFIMGEFYVSPQITPEMIPEGKTLEQVSISISAMEERGLIDAFNLLSPHTETIKRVAAQLEQKGKLSGEEVQDLLL